MKLTSLPLHNCVVFSVLFLLTVVPASLQADTLSIDTDYRVRGVSFQNTDFNQETKDDSRSYYSQRIALSLTGSFSDTIEIATKLTSLGVIGSTQTVTALPYDYSDKTPFIETAFIRFLRFANQPITVSIGRQNITCGDGLIIADNGTGPFTLHLAADYEYYLPWHFELFTMKTTENLAPKTDHNLYAGILAFTARKHRFDIGYFQDRDYSQVLYDGIATTSILKNYISLRAGRKERDMSYQVEYAMQSGSIDRPGLNAVTIGGYSYIFAGTLTADKSKLGKVLARARLSIASGDDNNTDNNETTFAPSQTKRFDGTERSGQGMLFAASSYDSFFTIPAAYTGINTLSVGTEFSPAYGLLFNVDYHLFSASQGPKGAPVASGFERIFGAEYAMGIEMNLGVRYEYSKYASFGLAYARYTPPPAEIYWPTRNPASLYVLDVTARF